jgi:hypothetical protein
MSDLPSSRPRPSLLTRWTNRSAKYFARNGFELQRFAFFVAFPIGVYWTFADPDRVEKMYQMLKPWSTKPSETLQSMPDDIMDRFAKGEEINDIIRDHAAKEAAKKERQRAQLEELREQQAKYAELSARQNVADSKTL